MKNFLKKVFAGFKDFAKRFWARFRDIFGIHRNSKYVKNYLNEANMRSGVFMSAVIVILEIWLIIRQVDKYVIDSIAGGTPVFQALFQNLWTYFLLMSLGGAMLVYCLQYLSERKSKTKLILSIVFAGISLALCCFLPFEFKYKSIKFTNSIYTYRGVLKLIFYGSIIAFNIAIIFAGIYRFHGGKRPAVSSVLVISLFALVCLTFGVMISYGDFTGTKVFVDAAGNKVTINDDIGSYAYEHKQIICFLMMSIYVACLLIWKPYVSVVILGSIFLGFHIILTQVAGFGGRRLPEGDEVNYITFFISLAMICISIYDQRISEAKKDEELEVLATKDTLTNLWSFEYFNTLVTRKIKDEQLKEGEWIFLFINVTSFKIYNDQKGFEKGNEFLLETGKILTEIFHFGLVTRQSDDHFVVFAKNTDIESKINLLNSRTARLDLDIRPGVKVGGYVLRDLNEDTHLSVEKARYACSELEMHGVGNYLRYDSKMHDEYRLVQYIVRHIDEAIQKGYIKAYYQPVVWSKGRQLCGVEALARWEDPKYGFLSPGKFVPALETSQLIYKLDIAMLRLVCKQIRHNLDNGEPVIPVSINFSRIDFNVVDIVTIIDNTIKEFDIPRDLFHVEITESALMNDADVLKSSIKKLHELGFAVWLDDFGSGYSSFNVLKDYEFDVLKLDMEFLVGFENNKKSKYLIQSVVQMADQIGIKTLSEGVETAEEAQFLESIGCGKLQGYLYGKPLSYEEMRERIDSGYYTLADEIQNKK